MTDITIEEVLQVTDGTAWGITVDDAYYAAASCEVGNYDFILKQRPGGVGPIYPSIKLIVKDGDQIVYEKDECSYYNHGPLTELIDRLRDYSLEEGRRRNQDAKDRFKTFIKGDKT